MSQQEELAALERQVRDRQQGVEELQQQLERWDDPAYVRAQARQRLKFVMPGEVGYIVLDGTPEELAQQNPSRVAAREVARSNRPWFGALWESVRQADQPGQPPRTSLQPETVVPNELSPAPTP